MPVSTPMTTIEMSRPKSHQRSVLPSRQQLLGRGHFVRQLPSPSGLPYAILDLRGGPGHLLTQLRSLLSDLTAMEPERADQSTEREQHDEADGRRLGDPKTGMDPLRRRPKEDGEQHARRAEEEDVPDRPEEDQECRAAEECRAPDDAIGDRGRQRGRTVT